MVAILYDVEVTDVLMVKSKMDAKRMKILGGLVLAISVVFLIVGQTQVSEADKELRAYYGDGFLGEAAYDMAAAKPSRYRGHSSAEFAEA